MSGGRPPLQLTEKEQISLIEHVAQGGGTVTWCRANNHHYGAVSGFISANEAFAIKYARAKEDQADYLADEIIQISDDGKNDTYEDENGNRRTDQDVIARSRLRVDSRKWIASKLKPKKYGDKIGIGGAEGLPPVETVTALNVIGVAAKKSDDSDG